MTERARAGRSIRYRDVADALRARVLGGELVAGRVLPSEAELSAAYGVSRVTVRRALELLRDEDLVDSRQGFGWFVAATPVRQVLGRLGTIEEQMAASGLRPERRVLAFAFVAAPPRVRQLLGTDQVLQVRRVNLADGEPFALVTVWCPAELASDLSRADVERSPFYELLEVTLAGATQTIGAAAASPDEAAALQVPAGSPVLRCERTTTDDRSRVVLVSTHVFPAHRTEFVVELAHADRSIAPSGLRLVE